jgi:hypothetical protein
MDSRLRGNDGFLLWLKNNGQLRFYTQRDANSLALPSQMNQNPDKQPPCAFPAIYALQPA